MLFINPLQRYFIVPGYIHISTTQDFDRLQLSDAFHLLPAKPFGGIIRVETTEISRVEICDFRNDVFSEFDSDGIYGGVIGNPGGMNMFKRIEVLRPARVPRLAVAAGLGRNFKVPSVLVTVEHSADTSESYIVIVFKDKTRAEKRNKVV